jgi:hypothetical protein
MALKHETTLGHAVGHVSDRDASRCGNGGRRTPIIGLIARRVCHCRAAGRRASSHKVSVTSGGPMNHWLIATDAHMPSGSRQFRDAARS